MTFVAVIFVVCPSTVTASVCPSKKWSVDGGTSLPPSVRPSVDALKALINHALLAYAFGFVLIPFDTLQ